MSMLIGKKKKNKNQMAEWLENEGIDEQDVKLFKGRLMHDCSGLCSTSVIVFL